MEQVTRPEGPLGRLAELMTKDATGEFACRDGEAELRVYLQHGRIAWAADSQNPRLFARHLQENAAVGEERLNTLVAECHATRIPLAQAIVGAKLASPAQVRAALRHQLEPVLATLGRCSSRTSSVFLPRQQDARLRDDVMLDLSAALGAAAATREADTEQESSFADVGESLRSEPAQPGAAVLPAAAAAGAPRPPAPPPPGPQRAAATATATASATAPRAAATSSSPEKPAAPGPDRAAPQPAAAAAQRSRRPLPLLLGVGAAVVGLGVAGLALRGRGSSAPATTAAAPARSSAPATPTAKPAARGGPPIVVGIAVPQAGGGRDLARDMRTGLEAAFAEVNAGGGVAGRRIELVAVDGPADAAQAERVASDLVEGRQAVALVGDVGALASARAARGKVVLLGARAGTGALAFAFRPSPAQETAAAVRYLLEVRRLTASQLALFAGDDEMGRAGVAGAEEELRRQRQDPAAVVRAIHGRGVDVAGAIGALEAQRPRLRAIVTVTGAAPALHLVERLGPRAAGLVITAVSAVDADAFALRLAALHGAAPEAVFVTQVVPPPSSKGSAAMQYRDALQRYAPNEKPGFASFEGYVVGKLLVEGARKAGDELTPDTLGAALEQLHDLDLGLGAPLSFSATEHEASHEVFGTLLQRDGTYRQIRLE